MVTEYSRNIGLMLAGSSETLENADTAERRTADSRHPQSRRPCLEPNGAPSNRLVLAGVPSRVGAAKGHGRGQPGLTSLDRVDPRALIGGGAVSGR